jgi:predicted Zn finger-like uncharacterized protein
VTIRITCPSCQASYLVDDELRGKRIRCSQCEEPVSVPDRKTESRIVDRKGKIAPVAVSRGSADGRPASGRDREAFRTASKKGSGGLLLVLLLGGGALVVLLVVGAGALILGGWFIFGTPTRVPKDGAPVAVAEPDAAKRQENPPWDVKQPLPEKIADATLQRVKRSTAYLHVTMPGGARAEGTGFFAVEPGIVITNAHVLGMKQAQSLPPDSVEVVVNSGEQNEFTLRGTVLGVDGFTDLAVLRVPANGLPPPLAVESATSLTDLQKLWYTGFPFGKKLGTNVTTSEAAVSSLRKDKSGTIAEVQLTGNMQPGNSGGPVVDSLGRVVGVARAIISGTGINFAIPGEHVKQILGGRLAEATYSEPFLNNNQPTVPVSLKCLDPLGRVRSIRVEVWAGAPGPDRPFSYQQPTAMPGDSPRQSSNVVYADGIGTGDLPLPALQPGQVYWMQPVLVNAAGATQWQPAQAVTAVPPLQRSAASLVMKTEQRGERSLKMKASVGLTIYEGKEKYTEGLSLDANLVEVLFPGDKLLKSGAKVTRIRVGIGPCQFIEDSGGKRVPIEARYHKGLCNLSPSPSFVVDASGRFQERNQAIVSPKFLPRDKETLEMMQSRIIKTYEESLLYMPNRMVNPLESWQAKFPIIVGKRPKTKVLDIDLNCTYQGTRVTDGRSLAVIRLAGALRARDKAKPGPIGKAVGRAVFDIEAGYLAQFTLRISSEFEIEGGAQVVLAENIELIRGPGNPLGIAVNIPKQADPLPASKVDPPPPPSPLPPVKGKVVLNAAGHLSLTDASDPEAAGRRFKAHEVTLQTGKQYVIDMRNGPGSSLSPLVKLFDAKNQKVAESDNNGRITCTPTVSGAFLIRATTSRANETGGYELIVTAVD